MLDKDCKILAIDDNEDILFSLKLLLKNHVGSVKTSTSPEDIPSLMKEDNFDIILLDMNFTKDAISGQEGYDWLNKILEIDPDSIVLFITAYGDIEKSVKAIKAGATDFVLKPWNNEKLIATISSAYKLRQTKKEVSDLKQKQKDINSIMNQGFDDFIGESPQMKEVYNTILKVAQTDANVLILGENGTGKELVARSLHRNSTRSNDSFISVDLGAVHENIFESEMYGHVKGAYTDAKTDKKGRFELADKGTIFLDEIGNLSIATQTKLLTVLERREVTRVGANKIIPLDIRFICATNMGLYDMVDQNTFRQDLLYRINTIEIKLPPLRERTGDIILLTKHFLDKYSKKYKKNITKINSAVEDMLNMYKWPGNVRELQHVIERAVIMCDSNELKETDLNLPKSSSENDLNFKDYNLDNIEKDIIKKVLKENNGNITKAASKLGLTRTSLYRRLEKHDL